MPGKQPDRDFDVIVVGGGPAGCTMAALLGRAGIKVACIDRDAPQKSLAPEFDTRTTAISFGSRAILDRAGAWQGLESFACPIKDIKITDNGSPTLLQFFAKDVGADAFGWVIENRYLRKNLYAALNHDNILHIAPKAITGYTVEEKYVDVALDDGTSLRAKLVIGADGRHSFTREWMGIETRGWSYNQRALVCLVHHDRPHDNIALEDFRGDGPFAVLPMLDDDQGRHRSALVWTEHGPEKHSAIHWNQDVFQAALRERFPPCYGDVQVLGDKASYPLSLAHAHEYIGPRMALVADAAHGIHPIAGQGLNIGLRDIATLADILSDAKDNNIDLGNQDILRAYQRARRPDNMAMAAATDTLNKLFSNNRTSLRILRKVGLKVIERVPPAKQFFMRYAMGSAGILSKTNEKD